MKMSRNKSSRRCTKTVPLDASDRRQDTGLSPSKRHREKLNNVMDELSELLPLSSDAKTGLDRLSILKLTVSFFQTQNLIKGSVKPHHSAASASKKRVHIQGVSLSEMALEAVGGFFIVLTDDGNVYYVSENVKNYLGYSQTRLMHQEFFSHVHPDDLQGLKSCFEECPSKKQCFTKGKHDLPFTVPDSRQECYCNIRCHAGRLSSHISPFYYKCFRFYGHIKMVKKSEKAGSQYGFFALCSPVSRSENIAKPMKEHAERYTCKMDAAMANLQLDSSEIKEFARITGENFPVKNGCNPKKAMSLKVLRFNEQDLIGKSAYFFFHPDDLSSMAMVHERLMKDFKVSITFRIMKGNGKWQWVRGTGYSIIKNGQIEGMVANNVFVSDEEGAYYKALNIKEMKEWKEEQAKALIKYQSSTSSSSCSSPCDSGGCSSDAETSFQSVSSCKPSGFVVSTANDGILIQTSSVNTSPSHHNGYALPLTESDYLEATSSTTAAGGIVVTKSNPNAISHEQSRSPHCNADVALKSEAVVISQVSTECLTVIDNEMVSIIKELQGSFIDGGVDSAQPFSSPSQKSDAIQQPFLMTNSSTAGMETSGNVPTEASFMTNPYPVASAYAFHSVGGVFDAPHIDDMSLLQDGQPFVAKHLNGNPSFLQLGVPKNNGEVEENNVYLKDSGRSAARHHEDSFKDFEMLPLGDIESILSHESHLYSSAPDSLHPLPSNLPILEHDLMDPHSNSLSESYEQKLTATNLPAATGGLYESQGNPSLDAVTTSDFVSCFNFTVSNAMDLSSESRMDLPQKRDDIAYLGDTRENYNFADHHSFKNQNTPNSSSEPINRANSMVKFNPQTGKLNPNLSIEPAVAWMDRK